MTDRRPPNDSEVPTYRVVSATLAEGYTKHDDNYFDLHRAGFNDIIPTEFPAIGQLAVAVTVTRADDDRFMPGEAMTVNVYLVDPDGNAELVGALSWIQDKDVPGAPAPLVQTVLVDLVPVVRKPGVHVVRVSITEGMAPVELPLFVRGA